MNENDLYQGFGTYPNADAKLILDAFVENDIRYDVNVDDSKLKNMNPIIAAYGGTFGQSSGVAISVHQDDMSKAMELCQKVLNLEV